MSDCIVITGAGAVTALGLDRESAWNAVRAGGSGIRPLTALEWPEDPAHVGGEAPILSGGAANSPREVLYLSRALNAALMEAGIGAGGRCRQSRCAVVLGTTLAGMRSGGEHLRTGELLPLVNVLAGTTLAQALGDRLQSSFNVTICAACASGLASIGLAVDLLRTREFDVVIAGGYDPISEYAFAGFRSLRLVSSGAILPFSKTRDGMVLGEGYGVVVLEREGDARSRGAQALASVLAAADSSDAHHLTQPHPEGDGAARAITAALESADLPREDIDLIVAHATSTPNNDAAECAALRSVFGAGLTGIPVVAFKSHFGHALGGAGTVELIMALHALRDGFAPPTPKVRRESLEFPDIFLVTGDGVERPMRTALTLSLGFGGANSAVIVSNADGPCSTNPSPEDEVVCITGAGIVAPGIIGRDQLPATLARRGAIDDAQLDGLIDARRTRRMSPYVRSILAAATLAVRDAGVADDPAIFTDCAATLGTMYGSTSYSTPYYREIVERGIDAANPLLFAEGVPNAASAHLSLMLGLKGPSHTFLGTRVAGLDALRMAAMRIRSGRWPRALVGAGEESSELVARAMEHLDSSRRSRHSYGAYPTAAAAVILVLEPLRAATTRGARVLGVIDVCVSREAGQGTGRAMIGHVEQVARDLGDLTVTTPVFAESTIGRIVRAGVRRADLCQQAHSAESSGGPPHFDAFSATCVFELVRILTAARAGERIGVIEADWSGAVRGVVVRR